MRRQKHDFQNSTMTQDSWYDLRDDWVLIESSLAAQYGIRIRNEADMPWMEFCTLVGGLMPETPLGQVIGIRAETDMEVIRKFSSGQDRIYSEWQKKVALNRLEDTEKLDRDMKELNNMLAKMFG